MDFLRFQEVKVLLSTGIDGKSITDIEKTSTAGAVDTYTITFSDGTKTTFNVTNGTSIASVVKTSSVGLVDTYTITLTNGDTTTFNVTNGESAPTPHLVINSDTGSTVTATLGANVFEAVETSTGVFEVDVDAFGTYLLESDLQGVTASKTFVVDACKIYTTELYHFRATITVEFPENTTCTLTDGTTSQTASVSPHSFTVTSAGTYTASIIYNNVTYSDTVTITTDGETANISLPTSSDAPIDDINLLSMYAGIEDTFADINELIADSISFSAVLESTEALDYLVRCTDFISPITSDQTAMSLIGLNDTASDTLLADYSWRTAICSSSYFESVLNVKIPYMTSATAPSGVVTSSGATTTASYEAYHAFDNNSVTYFEAQPTLGESDVWLEYKFAEPVKMYKCYMYVGTAHSTNTSETYDYSLATSLNNTDFTDIMTDKSVTLGANNDAKALNDVIATITEGQYFKLNITRLNIPANIMKIFTMRLYGRAIAQE